jgi:hypothetical protein
VLGIELALVWIVGGWLLLRDARLQREPLSRFVLVYPAAFLLVHAVMWLAALPEFFTARDGITPSGTPVGSGWYVLACFVAASGVLALLLRPERSDQAQ